MLLKIFVRRLEISPKHFGKLKPEPDPKPGPTRKARPDLQLYTKLLSNQYKCYKTEFWNKWLFLMEHQVQTLFLKCFKFSKKFDSYHLNLPKLNLCTSLMAKWCFCLMMQNRHCFFMDRTGYRPKFKRGYGYELGCGLVVMSMGWSGS